MEKKLILTTLYNKNVSFHHTSPIDVAENSSFYQRKY